MAMAYSYEHDPAAIYSQSFATVRREAKLDDLPEPLRPVAVRLIHACGMIDIVDDLEASTGAVDSARAALWAGKPILADCEMVASGVTRSRLPADNPVICTLNQPDVPDRARELETTRSAAAVESWSSRLAGAIVAIGNAPTALFHLLEMLEDGAPKPAVVLGFPVGFVGAAESKAALAAYPGPIEFITLHGRRGGSAIASAAVNALAGDPE